MPPRRSEKVDRKLDTSDRFHPHESWGGLVAAAGAHISRIGKADLRKAGLSHLSFGRIGVLSILLDRSATQAELCAELGQKPPSMKELLERLHNEGLVTHSADKRDRRKTNWGLSAKGRRDILKAKTVFRASGRHVDALFAKMEVAAEDLQTCKKILVRFVEVARLHAG